jgi:hypothetical protein
MEWDKVSKSYLLSQSSKSNGILFLITYAKEKYELNLLKVYV